MRESLHCTGYGFWYRYRRTNLCDHHLQVCERVLEEKGQAAIDLRARALALKDLGEQGGIALVSTLL